MKLESLEVVLWFRKGDWNWELNLNAKRLAKSVYMNKRDAQNTGKFVANQLEAEYREATQDEIDERVRDEKEWEQEVRAQRSAGLGVVKPKHRRDLFDLIQESESPPTDQ